MTIKDLADNATYQVKVVSVGISNGKYVESEEFISATVKTLRNLSAPKNLKLQTPNKNTLKVNWNKVANAKGYYVYYKVAGTKNYKLYKTTTATSVTISNLKKDTKYAVKVVPYGLSANTKIQSDNFIVKNIKTKKK